MKSRDMLLSSYALSVLIAGVPCTIVFNNAPTYHYFKNRFYPLHIPSNEGVQLNVIENNNEFTFSSSSKTFNCKIRKKHLSSLEDVFFILMALLQYLLLPYKVLLLHGSSCIIRGKAYIFIAPSGTGKSTIINSVLKNNVLSDDIAVIKKVNSRYFVYSSPLDNKMKYKTILQKTTLGKIFFIKQASFTRFIKQDTVEAISELLHNNIFFWWLQLQKNRKSNIFNKNGGILYSVILDLLAFRETETLYFTKDLQFMSLL